MTDGSQDNVIQDGGVDAIDNCDLDGGVVDAGDAGPPSACLAMFNFESPAGCGLYGAFLNTNLDNPKATDGFTRLYHTPLAYCGRGAMAVDVDFNADTRIGGEILIPINRNGIDYTGKVLSLMLRGSAAGGPNMRFSVLPVTSRYEQAAITAPITTDWVPWSVTLPTPDASASGVIEISLQAHGAVDPYKGTIYIDEIDIRNPAPDGGTSDGPVSDARADADSGGAIDVRDAPAGS